MTKNRLEAFSDGVIAILITILVLDLKIPRGDSIGVLAPMLPVFFSYVLSFIFIAIYWNNHHHMLHAVERVNGTVLWANMHLLFWLSLVPFVTAWMGENNFAPWPVALYGMVFLMAAAAYYILTRSLILAHGKNSALAEAMGGDFKGRLSLLLYALGVMVAYFLRWVAFGLYVTVAIMWLIPDRRIEKKLDQK